MLGAGFGKPNRWRSGRGSFAFHIWQCLWLSQLGERGKGRHAAKHPDATENGLACPAGMPRWGSPVLRQGSGKAERGSPGCRWNLLELTVGSSCQSLAPGNPSLRVPALLALRLRRVGRSTSWGSGTRELAVPGGRGCPLPAVPTVSRLLFPLVQLRPHAGP